jgi:hypothetical protein
MAHDPFTVAPWGEPVTRLLMICAFKGAVEASPASASDKASTFIWKSSD